MIHYSLTFVILKLQVLNNILIYWKIKAFNIFDIEA